MGSTKNKHSIVNMDNIDSKYSIFIIGSICNIHSIENTGSKRKRIYHRWPKRDDMDTKGSLHSTESIDK